ncbi:hypothetical protein SEPCBS57363_002253 [Sporothrix epigloea]|uniref:HNH domain-containing protein n=1 Tax=Sporothrix epigloea TaxID=1892477 RepID=A0ABP0DEU2_9PEZI
MDDSTEPVNGVVDPDIIDTNYAIYRDALAAVLVDKLAEPEAKSVKKQRRKRGKKSGVSTAVTEVRTVIPSEPNTGNPGNGASRDAAVARVDANDGQTDTIPEDATDDLAEFVDYLARETFDLMPEELRTLAHHEWVANASLRNKYGVADDQSSTTTTSGSSGSSVPGPGSLSAAQVAELLPGLEPSPVADSMHAYGVLCKHTSAADLIAPALSSYMTTVAVAPPPPRSTRDQTDGCEICGRDWLPLSYHHLIPRFVHAKVVKRGWHRADELQNVAWLCHACHRRVHRFANHEDLARYYYTVERLLAEPEMRRYAVWASRLRWEGK